jgi:hypothetical protein
LRGSRCIIECITASGASGFLSGRPYLFSAFSERAYELDDTQARQWIKRYPLVLRNAQIHVRD